MRLREALASIAAPKPDSLLVSDAQAGSLLLQQAVAVDQRFIRAADELVLMIRSDAVQVTLPSRSACLPSHPPPSTH